MEAALPMPVTPPGGSQSGLFSDLALRRPDYGFGAIPTKFIQPKPPPRLIRKLVLACTTA